MASKVVIPFLVGMMLLTGVCNTLLTKYQDLQCVRNCDPGDEGEKQRFSQPVIQTAQMFIGEMGCWLVVAGFSIYRRYCTKDQSLTHGGYAPLSEDVNEDLDGGRDSSSTMERANPAQKALALNDDGRIPLAGIRIFMLALPACCDITGTTLMNVGLLFVAASIYQMTRGALVLFVGLFSVIFLRRKLFGYQWAALFIVVLGVGVVGLAGAIAPNPQAQPEPKSIVHTLALTARMVAGEIRATTASPAVLQTILGIFMIAGAQIFTATQFVLEEWILEHYALEPLKVVGWEGIFGFIVTFIGMIILHFAVGRTEAGRYGYFDMKEGWRQVTEYRAVAVSSLLIMISIGGFNFFGLSITRSVSATARSIIDTCRTLFIWIVSLGLGWETFKWLQIVGFALLVYGTFLFNQLITPPKQCARRRKREELLPEEPIEHM